MLEIVSELEREISLWLRQPEPQSLSADRSEHVRSEDSISNVESRTSFRTRSAASSTRSSASAKARSAARKAVLEARASTLQSLHQLQIEELRLQQRKAEVELRSEIAEAEAERKVYEEAEASEARESYHRQGETHQVNQSAQQSQQVKTASTPLEGHFTDSFEPDKTPLNPSAPEWHSATPAHRQGLPVSYQSGSFHHDESFQRLMENQDRQSHAFQQLVQQQQQGVMSLTLPQPDMQVFSGDPVDYCDFIRAFEHLVKRKTPSSSSRLYYLVQYTSGPVQELMKSCLSMQEKEGYLEARRLLRERYGQNYRVTAAHVQRLTEGPLIKAEDGAALQQFSIQ